MTRGKKVCKILKEIRQQIANKNDIEYITSECHFQGECKGSCPKCEAEVRYLENELNKRRQLGKTATIAGISLGIVGSFTACNGPKQENVPVLKQDTIMETVDIDTISIMDTLASGFGSKDLKADANISSIISIWGVTEGFLEPLEGEVAPPPVPGEIIQYDENVVHNEDCIFAFSEVQPEYPDGDRALRAFIQENLVYPKEAQEKGIERRVYVQFVVEKDGSLSDINVIKGIDNGGGCNEEVMRIVKMMPKWEPGKNRGEAVRTRYAIPVAFKLE